MDGVTNGRPLATKVIQRAGSADLVELQFHAENAQHGKRLARTELWRSALLKAGQRFLGDAGLRRNVALLEAESAPAIGYSSTQFLEGLHLMYSSKAPLRCPETDVLVKTTGVLQA